MARHEFMKRLRSNPHPVVVDFWAPWCGPCRAIEPILEKLGKEYTGRVDLWKVNADERPELLRSRHIYGIPTLIAYHDGREVGRRTEAASETALSSLFESAFSGEKPDRKEPALPDRFLRLEAGLVLVSLAILSGLFGPRQVLAGLRAVIPFTPSTAAARYTVLYLRT